MSKYKERLIALCEALEIVNVEEFIEQPPKTMKVMGEYITENCKWYKDQWEQVLEAHPDIMLSEAFKRMDDESNSTGRDENAGGESL